MVPSSSIKAFEGMGCVHVSFSSGGGLGGFRLPASALSLLRQQMALIRNILVPSPRFFLLGTFWYARRQLSAILDLSADCSIAAHD